MVMAGMLVWLVGLVAWPEKHWCIGFIRHLDPFPGEPPFRYRMANAKQAAATLKTPVSSIYSIDGIHDSDFHWPDRMGVGGTTSDLPFTVLYMRDASFGTLLGELAE